MKRYLVFAFDSYYPAGGWDDFRGMFDEEAGARARAYECVMGVNGEILRDFAQVVDTQENRISTYKLGQAAPAIGTWDVR